MAPSAPEVGMASVPIGNFTRQVMSSQSHGSYFMIASESEQHTSTHTTKRLALPRLPTPPYFRAWPLCTTHAHLLQDTAPTSTRSIGFCVIWVCISSSSSSNSLWALLGSWSTCWPFEIAAAPATACRRRLRDFGIVSLAMSA